MDKVTADNLVHAINRLDKGISYNYINPRNSGRIKIVSVEMPDGPIRIKRWDPESNDISKRTEAGAREESISREMLWTAANAFTKESPVNMDRVFAGSYNLRSVLEALIANTPEFYYCYPKRVITMANGNSQQKAGQKHLMWVPSNPHELGKLEEIPTEIANDSGILRNHISNVLRELKEQDLVECLNPQSRKGRLYRLSKEGFEVLEDLE